MQQQQHLMVCETIEQNTNNLGFSHFFWPSPGGEKKQKVDSSRTVWKALVGSQGSPLLKKIFISPRTKKSSSLSREHEEKQGLWKKEEDEISSLYFTTLVLRN